MQILNVLLSQLIHVNHILMILILIAIENMNHLDFVFTLKVLMELINYSIPIVYTKQTDDKDIAKIFVEKLEALTKKDIMNITKNQNL